MNEETVNEPSQRVKKSEFKLQWERGPLSYEYYVKHYEDTIDIECGPRCEPDVLVTTLFKDRIRATGFMVGSKVLERGLRIYGRVPSDVFKFVVDDVAQSIGMERKTLVGVVEVVGG